jgi:hypothetical protein
VDNLGAAVRAVPGPPHARTEGPLARAVRANHGAARELVGSAELTGASQHRKLLRAAQLASLRSRSPDPDSRAGCGV